MAAYRLTSRSQAKISKQRNSATTSVFSLQPHLRRSRSHDPLNVTICHPRQDFTFGSEVSRGWSTLDSRSQVIGAFNHRIWSQTKFIPTLVPQFNRCCKMADSRDQRSSSLESVPKFPKCSDLRRRGTTTSAANNVGSMKGEGGHECSRQTPCGVCESWLPENWDTHEKAKSQKLKRKAAKKLQEAIDYSIEIHGPEETLGLKEKRSRKSDETTHHKSKSKSDKPATEGRPDGVQSQVVRPLKFDGTARTETGTYQHHRCSRDEEPRRDVTPATVVLLDTHRNGDARPITTAVTIE